MEPSAIARDAIFAAYRVIEGEMNGEMSYVDQTTVRKMTDDDRERRILTLAIDEVVARRSILTQKKVGTCVHGVALRGGQACVECTL